ncbi:MAG: putative phage tail protein [Chloroflexota bacterium]
MVLSSTRGLAMKGWLPPLYAASRVLDALLEAEGQEFDAARAALLAVLDQWFVATATWTLDRWETLVGLPVNDSQTDTERREKILSRLRGYGTATINRLEQVGEAFGAGELDVVEDYQNYTLTIIFVDTAGVPSNLSDLQATLRAVAPAHLALEYQFRYSTWDRLDAAALTWDELDALNLVWDEFDVQFT